MSPFELYFPLGFKHIADLSAYDHMLFLVALCGSYGWKNWRLLLGLITVFSIGHTSTLTLAVLQVIKPQMNIVELIIPFTIFVTAFSNIATRSMRRMERINFAAKYMLTFVFGLIHGMGFSNYFQFLVTGEDRIGGPLFFFTVGIECGQIVIIAAILLVARLMTTLFFFKPPEWNLFLSGIAVGISLLLIVEKSAFLFTPPLTANIQAKAPLCPNVPNGSVSASVKGGFPEYRYQWSSGHQLPTVENLPPGYYTVTVEDSHNGVATAAATIPKPAPFEASIVKDSLMVGWRFNVQAKVIGGRPLYRFLWSDGQTTQNAANLLPGKYSVTVSDENGCSISAETTLNY